MLRDGLTYADVLAALQRDSPGTRLGTVMKLRCRLPNEEWWRLLGLVWYACDHIAAARKQLTAELREAPLEDLRMMMSRQSADAWDVLPPEFTVYRGCGHLNRPGLSWSTSQAVAEAYAHRQRDDDPTVIPLVLTGAVQRRFCVLMLDRSEAEVVAWNVGRVREHTMAN